MADLALTFDAQKVGDDLAIQTQTEQVGMQVVGDVGTYLKKKADDNYKDAKERLADAKDPEAQAQAKADMDSASMQEKLWGDDGAARIGLHAVAAGLGAATGGGNVLGSVAGTISGDEAVAAVSPALDGTLGSTILKNVVSGAAGALVGGMVGGASGAVSGANGALGADLYNRQLHPEEKTLAQKIAEKAKAQGITNPDGSPVTVDQIENAMRAANNSQYGEFVGTGMAVPLNENTPANALYDTTGMQFKSDSAGNKYEMQDPSMLVTPSQALQGLIVQNTGGTNSPYSWNVPSPQSAQASGGTPKVDPYGPFSPGWNTGDYSAGLGSTYRGLAPDYATVGGSFLSLSGAGAVNLYDGTKYLSAGPTQNFPTSSWKPGVVGTVGWIWGAHDANATNAFLNGDGNQAFVSVPTEFGFNVVGALTHAYGGSTALELGITPKGDFSAGVTPWSHGVPVLDKKQQ